MTLCIYLIWAHPFKQRNYMPSFLKQG